MHAIHDKATHFTFKTFCSVFLPFGEGFLSGMRVRIRAPGKSQVSRLDQALEQLVTLPIQVA